MAYMYRLFTHWTFNILIASLFLDLVMVLVENLTAPTQLQSLIHAYSISSYLFVTLPLVALYLVELPPSKETVICVFAIEAILFGLMGLLEFGDCYMSYDSLACHLKSAIMYVAQSFLLLVGVFAAYIEPPPITEDPPIEE